MSGRVEGQGKSAGDVLAKEEKMSLHGSTRAWTRLGCAAVRTRARWVELAWVGAGETDTSIELGRFLLCSCRRALAWAWVLVGWMPALHLTALHFAALQSICIAVRSILSCICSLVLLHPPPPRLAHTDTHSTCLVTLAAPLALLGFSLVPWTVELDTLPHWSFWLLLHMISQVTAPAQDFICRLF